MDHKSKYEMGAQKGRVDEVISLKETGRGKGKFLEAIFIKW